MALIHTNLLSVSAGVSKQDKALRLPNHCEEMINAYPTVQYGLKRRNPTVQLTSTISLDNDQFIHTYDRGLSGDAIEQYVITIDPTNGLKVLDVIDGTYKTVTFSTSALKYLQASEYKHAFSATTIQDTTFITNKDVIPTMQHTGATITANNKSLNVSTVGFSSSFSTVATAKDGVILSSEIRLAMAPATMKTWSKTEGAVVYYCESSVGAMTTITVDGTPISYTTNVLSDNFNIYPESVRSYRMNLYRALYKNLSIDLYYVSVDTAGIIKITKLDGSAITVTSAITYPATTPIVPPATWVLSNSYAWVAGATYQIGSTAIGSISTGSGTINTNPTTTYNKEAFVWIKQASPDVANPYTYYLSLYELDGTLIGTTSTASASTVTVAASLATWVSTQPNFTGTAGGSVCKITRSTGVDFYIVVSDTYGSQASVGLKGHVGLIGDLPKYFPFKDTIFKVGGLQGAVDYAYWIKYDGSTWVEWYDPAMKTHIIPETMPHKLVRNADFTFTMSEITYDDIDVGDSTSQVIPSFIGSSIRDVFFTGGRLGFLTRNGVSITQQGSTTNFFRTTVLILLDDSAISTYIDSTRSVGLEFAIELQNVVVLFGDKQQFAIDSSKAISPSTLVIQPVSTYEIDKNVRPIGMGDSILFVVDRGEYSSVMEMTRSSLSTNVKADDISSHVPQYISSGLTQLVGSQRNNIAFMISPDNPTEIYVYKYLYQDGKPYQQAWCKWQFGMEIKNIFVFDRNLYVMGARYVTTIPLSQYTFLKNIDYSKTIDYSTVIAYNALPSSPSFEKLDIDTQQTSSLYRDNGTINYETRIELSKFSVADSNSQKEIRGNLLLKTIEIKSEVGSSFGLKVHDDERNTTRIIPSLYTIDRKPYLSGNAKNMTTSIISDNGNGFQISAISIECQYNSRSIKKA